MRSPFKFLDAYTVQDKNVFFGRDNEIESLYSLVFKTNLLIVYGLSGTGKTSVIQCGLASRFDGPDWYPMFVRRNDDLNESILAAMRNALGKEAKDDLIGNVSYLIRKTLRPVYLILDQFEELFILGSQKEQDTFMQNLRKLLDAGLNTKVILVMREEYIGQLYPFEQVIPELFDFRFRVEPMGITKVQSVIRDSFDKFNIHLAEPKAAMLQYMTEQISDPKAGIALPYLQVYLDMLYREAWRKKYGNKEVEEKLPRLDIAKEDIESLGRIGNVLDKFLTQQVAELTTALKQTYPEYPQNGIQVILDLFATDEGTKRPLQYTRKGDEIALDPTVTKALPGFPPGSITKSIELLEHARILRVREDTIELAHDSLAAIVDQKRTDEQRQLQNIRRRLTNAFDEFLKTGVYLNAKQLASFDEYLPKLQLSTEIINFLKQSEDDVRRRAHEERDRAHQEQQAKQHKKLARTRGILLSVVAIFAGIAGLFAFFAQRNLNHANNLLTELGIKSESLQNQIDTTKYQQDSISNILVQVDQQLVRIDSVINGYFPDPQIEIQKAFVTLKSLVSNDTLSEEDLEENYASLQELQTTPSMLNEFNPAEPQTEFSPGEDVNAWAMVRTRKPKELLQVKWFGSDGVIVGKPDYKEVIKTAAGSTAFSVAKRFAEPGSYQVKVYNSAGREIGATQFTITNEAPSDVRIEPGNFKIVGSVIDNKPGKEMTKFRPGSTVYYWARIHCPVENDFVTVQVEMPDGKKWEKKHGINRNLNTGYLIWSAKGFGLNGHYKVRILNSSGGEIGMKEFSME